MSPQEQQAPRFIKGVRRVALKASPTPQDSSGSMPCRWSWKCSGKNQRGRGGWGEWEPRGPRRADSDPNAWRGGAGRLESRPASAEGGRVQVRVRRRPPRPCLGSGALNTGWGSLLLAGRGDHGNETQEARGRKRQEALGLFLLLLIVPKAMGARRQGSGWAERKGRRKRRAEF